MRHRYLLSEADRNSLHSDTEITIGERLQRISRLVCQCGAVLVLEAVEE